MNNYEQELIEYNNRKKQQQMREYSGIQDSMERWLKENKSIFIQSLPFTLCQKDLILGAAEKVGLKLAEFDNAKLTNQENIISNINEKKAKGILLNAMAEENIESYANTAKNLNIPLIVSVTRKVELDDDIAYYQVDFGMSAYAYQNAKDIQKSLDELEPIIRNNKGGLWHIKPKIVMEIVVDRMKNMRNSPEQLAETEKPKLK